MENVEMWRETEQYLQAVLNIFLIVLPALAAIAITSASGATMIAAVKTAWKTVRPAIDQPTDVAVLFLAAKTGRDPLTISTWLIQRGDQVIAAMTPEGEAVK